MKMLSLVFLLASLTSHALPLESADPSQAKPENAIFAISPSLMFSVDERLKKNVDFWVQIYSKFTSREGVIHDAKYIDHVYEVVALDSKDKKRVKRQKLKWKAILLSLHRKQRTGEDFTSDEKKVFELFKDVSEPNKFLNAAHRKRLRFQLGQKDCFLDGLYQSGRFLHEMEEIFKNEGLPIELTRLPFVESSFNMRARSKVGASGIWQFMRSTARFYLKINTALDERNDPIRATEAAAKLLKLNYESLKSWPLAVTAYNHGRKGMMRAVRRVGSDDLEELVSEYHSRSFGFASGNFFTELLAAIEVERNSKKYFGEREKAKPIQYVEVRLPDYIELSELIRYLKLNSKTFADLNPGLSEAVYANRLLVPQNYLLRLPCASYSEKEKIMKQFWEVYTQIPASLKRKAQRDIKYDRRYRLVKQRVKNRSSSAKRKGARVSL